MTCRLCKGNWSPLFSLGDHYLSDFVAVENVHSGLRSPISVVRCDSCCMVQFEHTAPVNYTKYWYRSGITDTMRAALKDVVSAATSCVNLQSRDIVLDIGSNDGTLLSCYPADVWKVGVEPALNVDASRHVNTLVQDKWSHKEYEKQVKQPAKIITACGMLYDLDDPQSFVDDVAQALHRDGVFVAQLMCLKQTLQSCDIGNFCHEHLEYYTLANVERLLDNAGLKLVDVQENKVNGGSYRIFAVHKSREYAVNGHVSSARREDWYATTKEKCMQMFARAEKTRMQCVQYVRSELTAGRTVFLYGASTKGNTILQYYGLNSDTILLAADRSPEKYGLYTVGTGIRIVNEMTARNMMPDNFLVMPYAFIDEFIAREADMPWRTRGGKFIVPLPEFKVL